MAVKTKLDFKASAVQSKTSAFPADAPVSRPFRPTEITSGGRMRYALHVAATFNVGIASLGFGEMAKPEGWKVYCLNSADLKAIINSIPKLSKIAETYAYQATEKALEQWIDVDGTVTIFRGNLS
jgi:hypothetical protein